LTDEEVFFHRIGGRIQWFVEVIITTSWTLIELSSSHITTESQFAKVAHNLLLLLLTVNNPREGSPEQNQENDKTSDETTVVLFDFRADRSSLFGSSLALETSGDAANEDGRSSAVGVDDVFFTPVAVRISLASDFVVRRALGANTFSIDGTNTALGSGAVGRGVRWAHVLLTLGNRVFVPEAARISIAEDVGIVTASHGLAARSSGVVPNTVGSHLASGRVGDVEASLGVALGIQPHAVGVEETRIDGFVAAETRDTSCSDHRAVRVAHASGGIWVFVATSSSALTVDERAWLRTLSGTEDGASGGIDEAETLVVVVVTVGRCHASSLVARVGVAGTDGASSGNSVPTAARIALAGFLGGVAAAGGREATSEGDSGEASSGRIDSVGRTDAESDGGERTGSLLGGPGAVGHHHQVAFTRGFVDTPADVRGGSTDVVDGLVTDEEGVGEGERVPLPHGLSVDDSVTNTSEPSVVLASEEASEGRFDVSVGNSWESTRRRSGLASNVGFTVRDGDGAGGGDDTIESRDEDGARVGVVNREGDGTVSVDFAGGGEGNVGDGESPVISSGDAKDTVDFIITSTDTNS
jgi:hypothetical protein